MTLAIFSSPAENLISSTAVSIAGNVLKTDCGCIPFSNGA